MGTKPRLSLGLRDIFVCYYRRPFGGVTMAEKPRLSLGRVNLCANAAVRDEETNMFGQFHLS